MHIPRRSLTLCADCGQFARAADVGCPFCGAALARPSRPVLGATLGFAALSLFGMVAVPGCAYGSPPDCTIEGCADGYVCDTTTGNCDPEDSDTSTPAERHRNR